MAKTAFITGITGQDGAFLAKLLIEKGYRVHGGIRRTGAVGTSRLEELEIAGDVELHYFELLEESSIQRVVDTVAPDEIYNLAAQSFVGASFEQPTYTANADALGALRLLECLRALGAKTRFYQASSSEMFGKAQEIPQCETAPFNPRNPYGMAKLFAHWATINYRDSYGLHASSGILFNHESPLRGTEFVTRKITLGFARIAAGQQQELELGNLNAKRDWGFAGDYVEGMWRMLQQDTADDYVLATGRMETVRFFVESTARAFDWEIEWSGSGVDESGREKKTGRTLVRINPKFYRPAEIDQLVGDPTKAEVELGWRRTVELDELVAMMVEADKKRVAHGLLPF